jgi:transcriptional regulator NrdR family protein
MTKPLYSHAPDERYKIARAKINQIVTVTWKRLRHSGYPEHTVTGELISVARSDLADMAIVRYANNYDRAISLAQVVSIVNPMQED